jgi:hypothetical protein
MGLITNRLMVNGELTLGETYRIDEYACFEVQGKYGLHNTCIIKSGDLIAYLPQNGANQMAEYGNEFDEYKKAGRDVYVTLVPAHSKKYNRDYVACNFTVSD